MKLDNPYAAPQTLMSSESALPLAEGRTPGATRQKYPELSSGQLQYILDQRRVTEMMQRVWLILLLGLVAVMWKLSRIQNEFDQHLLKWCGILFVLLRIGLGMYPKPLGRWLTMFIDGVACLACLTASVCLLVISLPEFGMGLLLVSLPCLGLAAVAWFAGRACYVLARDPELFKLMGWNYIELEKELDYRLEHGID